ncbi:DUF389 domain-containing protein [Streptomyces sp. NPDC020807]|uniref:DUF389 domain-containing protein n=1 Tax=Streptomyces sp. NPDC020807 TaxID=3155119 RepID=UPI0033D220A9
MLHLRIIVPNDRTKAVVQLLESTVGTTHLVVLEGASREPFGDVVMCDFAREAGDELLGRLRDLEVDHVGSIAVTNIDLMLSSRADAAEKAAPGASADAVIWEQLTDATHEESTLSFTYGAFMVLATAIAACGVVLDNAILIVGAMAVGPEFGPLAGFCTAMVQRAPKLAARSMLALLAGFAMAILATTVFSEGMDALGLFSKEKLDAERPQTSFIWQPDLFSFVVALLAGMAGMLSLTSSKSGALVGVAISVTTIPAAANAAVALAYGEVAQMGGSIAQLLLNLFGIIMAGTFTLYAQKTLWSTKRGRWQRAPKL